MTVPFGEYHQEVEYMRLETHEANRKDTAKAISSLLGGSVHYEGMPSCAYTIGPVTLNRDAMLLCDDSEAWERLQLLFREHGWLESPDTGVVRIQMPDCTVKSAGNFVKLLYARQKLINAMLRTDTLYIGRSVIDILENERFYNLSDLETTLIYVTERQQIRGFSIQNCIASITVPNIPATIHDCSVLMEAIVKQASSCNRIKKDLVSSEGNEKYQANSWLTRTGFGGKANKDLRRRLMGHLSGYAAFRSDVEMKQHKDRLAEQRRIAKDLGHDHE